MSLRSLQGGLSTCLTLFALTAFTPDAADAHLSIIRQGYECFGSFESGDRHGQALAAGDFNGDGYDDLAMGSPNEGAGTLAQTGSVIVSYGSHHGITHLGSFSYHSSDTGVPLQGGARFGHTLAAADLDNDGFDDLVVGAPYADVAGFADAGRVFLFKGSPSGLIGWAAFEQSDLGGVSLDKDRFGYALAIGHFDDDIYDDLAIGAPSWDAGGGTVFVAYGTPGGPFGDSDIFAPDLMGQTYEAGDHFGFSLAAGNVIGDTRQDLVIGAPHRDAFGDVSSGICYVIPGSNAGLNDGALYKFTAKVVDDTAQFADFGFSLATGKFTPGVYDWIAVGEPDRWVGTIERGGRVVAVQGGADGVGNARILTQNMFGDAVELYDGFGSTLAAGYYGDEDTLFEDLIVGVPFEDFAGADDGLFHVLFSGSGGPGTGGYFIFSQSYLGDRSESGDEFGRAAVFGEFDYSNGGNIAVSAPGEDGDGGQVHVVAPWRQVMPLACKNSIVTDCQNNIVFSQKPFEQVSMASTAKILTILIACERTQLPPGDPRHMSLSDEYTVPAWVADDVGGSNVPLIEDEVITLENLMYTCLYRSGNDAAYAIADFLHGSDGPWDSVPLFVAEMNDRAQAIGMTSSAFNNPAGSHDERIGPDLGSTISSAYDMELLSRTAMANPLFYEISSQTQKGMTRQLPSGPSSVFCQNFFKWVLLSNVPGASGIKGGKNQQAGKTGCFAAEGVIGRTIVTTFGTDYDGSIGSDALNLLVLGLNDCATWQQVPDGWNDDYLVVFEGITASATQGHLLSSMGGQPNDRDLQIDLSAAGHETSANAAEVNVRRISEVELAMGETAQFGIAPFERHGEIRIQNSGPEDLELTVEFYYDAPYDIFVPAGETYVVPAFEGTNEAIWWTIYNLNSQDDLAYLTVEEDYGFSVEHDGEPTAGPILSVVVERDPYTHNDGYEVAIDWENSGGDYVVVVHDPAVVVDVPGSPDTPSGPELSDGVFPIAPAPNPFMDETRLRFGLARPARAALSIYDAGGRRVRSFPERDFTSGAWSMTWDGRNDHGVELPPGIYLYRFEVEGRPSTSGKLVRIE